MFVWSVKAPVSDSHNYMYEKDGLLRPTPLVCSNIAHLALKSSVNGLTGTSAHSTVPGGYLVSSQSLTRTSYNVVKNFAAG